MQEIARDYAGLGVTGSVAESIAVDSAAVRDLVVGKFRAVDPILPLPASLSPSGNPSLFSSA